jgi:hypothetical protein
MPPLLTATFSFICIFGGAIAGLLLQPLFPPHHLSKESQDSAKLGAGLIATMAALILGLLVSSSKGTYDRVNLLINEASANVLSLDQTLRAYGPEAAPARALLKQQFEVIVHDLWPELFGIRKEGAPDPLACYRRDASILDVTTMISRLPDGSDAQRILKNSALQISTHINQQRWQIVVESSAGTPLVLVAIPVFWITFLTFVYGIFAQRNTTVAAVLFFCSISIAGAIFLICQMSTPLAGSIKVPGMPMQTTLKGLAI